MENKMQQIIISAGIKFTCEADVDAYNHLTFEALPSADLEFNEVTRFIVGYEHIVVFGQNGRRLAVLKRKDYRGMAVDGKPIKITGDDFKTVSTDTLELEALRKELEDAGWDCPGNFFVKQVRAINLSGKTVRAINANTHEEMGTFDSMTALILTYPNAVRFTPNEELDTSENEWPVAVELDD